MANSQRKSKKVDSKPQKGETKINEVLFENSKAGRSTTIYQLAQVRGISQATAHRRLVRLTEKGLVEKIVKRQGKRVRHEYILNESGLKYVERRIEDYLIEIEIEIEDAE